MFKAAMPKESKAFKRALRYLDLAEAHEPHTTQSQHNARLACKELRDMSSDEKISFAKRAFEHYSNVYYDLGWEIQRREDIQIAYVQNDSSGMNLRALTLQNQVPDSVVSAAVRACGAALEYASLEQKNNRAIVDAARAQNAKAVRYAGPDLINDVFNEHEFFKQQVAYLEADIEGPKAQSTAKQKEHADDRARKRMKPSD